MGGRWAPKRVALVAAAAVAAVGMTAVPATAAPGCEHMLPPEDCEKYYYGTQETLGEILDPLYREVYETEDEAVELVLWAVDTYNGIYNCTVPWGYCPE